MRETIERELKLNVPTDYALPQLPGEPLEPRSFTSVYYDTDDFRLAEVGITLRRRIENGRGLWQLKLPREGARLELEQGGGSTAPPAEFSGLLVAIVRDRSLRPVATLRTRRVGVRVLAKERALGEVGEVVLDSVSLMEGRRVAHSFSELEFELSNGDGKAVKRVEQALRAAGASDGDGRPKLFRVLELAGPGSSDSATPGDRPRAAIREQYLAMLRHDPGTRLGSDPEDLHQFRVATRRLRAFLRAARPLLIPAWEASVREELKWLGGAVGPARDLDVLIEHIERESARLGSSDAAASSRILDQLRDAQAVARAGVLEALRSDRYLRLLDALERGHPPLDVSGEDKKLQKIAVAEARKLAKAGRTLGADSSDESLHAARIKLKRARYAAELAGGAKPVTGVSRFLRRAKELQDLLGTNQDSVVAEERLRAIASQSDAETGLAAGRLVERERGRRRTARATLPKVWSKTAQSGRRAWT